MCIVNVMHMYTSQYVNDVHAVMYTFMLIIIIIYINVIVNTIIVILPLSPSLSLITVVHLFNEDQGKS